MTTVLPPPSKRQKLATEIRSREQQELDIIPANAGSVKIQFVDSQGNPSVDGPVMVPAADANPKNLELLLNALRGRDSSESIPYNFYILPTVPSKKDEEISPIQFPTNIYKSLILPGLISSETGIRVVDVPQAVFKVQAVSRCGATMSGHGEAILATQFSPKSSSRMVSGSGDSTARIWDCDTGTAVHTLKGHTSWVLAVSWSPDDERIATGSMDNTVRLWDPKTGKQVGNSMKGHTKWVTSLSWEPYHSQKVGEPRIASSSKDSTVRIWYTNQQKIDIVLSGHKGSISCVKWGGTGLIYTASHDKTIKVWNANEGTLAHTLTAHAHWVNHLALSTDFALRTAYHDHTRKIPETSEEKIAKAKKRFLEAATFQGEVCERVVSASDDFTMYLWEPSKSKKPIARMLGHQKSVNHVVFSPDGQLIASSAFDNHTKLWNARDGKFINTLRGHVGPVYQAAFSADSRLLVTCSKDTTLKVWEMKTQKLAMDLPGHKDEVYAVDWSPDGDKVGSAGKDKAVRVWRN